MKKNFQVGFAINPLDDDSWFETEEEAIEHATRISSDHWREPVGVWDARSVFVWLFFEGDQFKRV